MKKQKSTEKTSIFDALPDDLVITILCVLTPGLSSPYDFICLVLICKKMSKLCVDPIVLSRAGANMLAVKAKNWSENAHKFLRHCDYIGNIEASYILGMIQFYCLENRDSGEILLRKAANKHHTQALYALSVIQFNGSGGSKDTKQDLKGGVSDSEQAAKLGHIDALREIGHCYQDGYGVGQDIAHGRQLLVQANFRELRCSPLSHYCRDGSLLSDFGCDVAEPDIHPANQFLIDWFELSLGKVESGLRLCSYDRCGRRETRPHEFRRCSVCMSMNYCSRGCQALHWKSGHRAVCVPHWDVGIQNLMP